MGTDSDRVGSLWRSDFGRVLDEGQEQVMGGLGEECRNRGQTASTKVLSCEYARRVSGKVRSEGEGEEGPFRREAAEAPRALLRSH